jgi:hypothetical protein
MVTNQPIVMAFCITLDVHRLADARLFVAVVGGAKWVAALPMDCK